MDQRLKGEGFRIESATAEPGSLDDAKQTADLAHAIGIDWIVLDGYQFSGRFQQVLKEAGIRLLVLDDYGHAEHYWADLVLNQNAYAEPSPYRNREPHTQLLLGTRFVLLRREFAKWRAWRREIPETARKILVTLGGSDADNATLKVIQAIQSLRLDDLQASIVVGAANPHLAELRAAIRDLPQFRVLTSVEDMPSLMSWADVAVAAGGTTSWELLYMGLPACILILADNQARVGPALEKEGAAFFLNETGWKEPGRLTALLADLLRDAGRRRGMSACGRELVDGRGGDRVVQAMLDLSSGVKHG